MSGLARAFIDDGLSRMEKTGILPVEAPKS
jgi:hypothetical protein